MMCYLNLIGPPNTGKTLLFQKLTGKNVFPVNYPGATVSLNRGLLKKEYNLEIEVIDTPGLTSLQASSQDQVESLKFLEKRPYEGLELNLLVLDSCQLKTQLYLLYQLKEQKLPFILCLTNEKQLEKQGRFISRHYLYKELGCPYIFVDAFQVSDLEKLVELIKKENFGPPLCLKAPSASQIKPQNYFEKSERLFKKIMHVLPQVQGRREELRKKIDRSLLHPILGVVIFCFIMSLFFGAFFFIAQPITDSISWCFDAIAEILATTQSSLGALYLLVEGFWRGLSMTLLFIPQIGILFLLLGVLESSGYLARGAVIVDRPLSFLGISGKAFVPFLSGFACAIPAMMATRSLEGRRQKFMMTMIIPLISCSARLPVYVLFIQLAFGYDHPYLSGVALVVLYVLGIVASSFVLWLSKNTFKEGCSDSFLLTIPSLRVPDWKGIGRQSFEKVCSFVKKALCPILIVSIILSCLFYEDFLLFEQRWFLFVKQALNVVMAPMGLDWRAGLALVLGFAAREVVISAFVMIYHLTSSHSLSLIEELRCVTFEGTAQPIFTTSSCLGLLVFYLFAVQCFPTLVASKNETGSWKWPILQFFSFTGGGYLLASFIVFVLRACGIA